MKYLYEFSLEGNQETVLVEVEDNREGVVRATALSEKIKKASKNFEESFHKVGPAAEAVLKKLRGLHDPADEISVAFGIKLSGEVGAVVAASSVEANYTVTMLWHKEKKRVTKRSIKTKR